MTLSFSGAPSIQSENASDEERHGKTLSVRSVALWVGGWALVRMLYRAQRRHNGEHRRVYSQLTVPSVTTK